MSQSPAHARVDGLAIGQPVVAGHQPCDAARPWFGCSWTLRDLRSLPGRP
jgi:hypothetical protein